jgi:KDO2-lipid IV(A) lauroyltransferase
LKALKHIYRPILALLLRALTRVACALPRRLVLRTAEGLGSAGYHLFPSERRRMIANLTLAFGRSRPKRDIVRIARDCFRSVTRSAFETLRLPAMSEADLAAKVDADSFEPIEKVLARGKGVLLLTAHFGSWEVLGAYYAARSGRPLHVVGRRLYFEAYNRWLVDLRRSCNVETVYQDEGARGALRVLRSNGGLGILGDQDVARLDGVFVDFFGRPAYTPTGPAAFARASGAGMMPIFMVWNGLRHRVIVLPEVEFVRTGDRKADDAENTQRWSRVVEGVIRRYPEQWAWFHRRWRTVGGGSAGGGG